MLKIFNLKYTNLETEEVIEQPFSIESYDGRENEQGFKTDFAQVEEIVQSLEPAYEGKYKVDVKEVNRLPRKYIKEHIENRQFEVAKLNAEIKRLRKLSAIKFKIVKEYVLEN